MIADRDQELMLKDKEISEMRNRGGSLNGTRSSSAGAHNPSFNQTWGHPGTPTLARETLKECSREVSELIREL